MSVGVETAAAATVGGFMRMLVGTREIFFCCWITGGGEGVTDGGVGVVAGLVVVYTEETELIVGVVELENTAGARERADNSWAVGAAIC